VVYLPLWKMMEFVSWDDDIPNIWKVIIHSCSKPPTRWFFRTKKTTKIGFPSHVWPVSETSQPSSPSPGHPQAYGIRSELIFAGTRAASHDGQQLTGIGGVEIGAWHGRPRCDGNVTFFWENKPSINGGNGGFSCKPCLITRRERERDIYIYNIQQFIVYRYCIIDIYRLYNKALGSPKVEIPTFLFASGSKWLSSGSTSDDMFGCRQQLWRKRTQPVDIQDIQDAEGAMWHINLSLRKA